MKRQELDRIVLDYLRKSGYASSASAFSEESGVPATESMAHHLDAEQALFSSVLFFNVAEDDPTVFKEAFGRLVSWVAGSLDLYRYELSSILYPVFIHMFLNLHEQGASSVAQQLFNRFKPAITNATPLRMQRQRMEELQDLQGISAAQHILTNRTAQAAKSIRYPVSMCTFSFKLLNNFLSSSNTMLLVLYIVNQWVRLDVNHGSPASVSDSTEDEGFGLLSMGESGVVTCDVLGANTQSVKLGLLKTDPEFTHAQQLRAREGAAKDNADGPDSEKAKKKKKAEADGKDQGGKPVKSRVPLPLVHVEAELPLSDLDEDETAAIASQLQNRMTVNEDELPSCAFFTFVNTHQTLNSAAISRDGSMVVGGFADSSIRIYDLESASASRTNRAGRGLLDAPEKEGGPGSELDADGMEWEGKEGDSTLQPEEADSSRRGVPDPADVGTRPETQPDTAAKSRLTCLWGHSAPVYSLSWSANERYLLSASADSTIRLWSMELGTNLVSYHGHNHPVWAVEASPQGHYFASASADKTARIWSTERKSAVRLLVGHQSDVDCLKWHPSCNYIATGSTDTTVRLWHVPTGSCSRILVGHGAGISSLAMSPCGRQLASGSVDGTVCIWDIAEGRRMCLLKGHRGPVWALDYSNGLECPPILASGGADCTLRFWGSPGEAGSGGGLSREATTTAAPDPPSGMSSNVALLKTYPTKSTPIHNLRFTTTNLLTATGALTLRQRANC